jgi:hypothetical protein
VRGPLVFIAALAALPGPAEAQRIANPIAVFNGLDKITGITTTFEVAIGEEKRFGGLIIKPKACYSRPVTEEPKTSSFVQVVEIEAGNAPKRIFSGWMFAESPGLSAVEHPIYDVWLTGCRDPKAPPPVVEDTPDPSTLGDHIEEGEPAD